MLLVDDHFKLKTKFLCRFVSKLITMWLQHKLGGDIELKIHEVEVAVSGIKATAKINIDVSCDKSNLEKYCERLVDKEADND